MKTKKIYQLTVIISFLIICACQTNAQSEILAQKNEYQLTQNHINAAISLAEEFDGPLTITEKEAYTQEYIAEFLMYPKQVIQELEGYKSTPQPTPEPKEKTTTNLAAGHQKVHEVLGSDIGEMQFDTQAANTFRDYMANSLLSSGSNSYDSGYGSSSYSSSEAKIQFCADGTFVQALSGEMNVSVEGMSVSSDGDNDYMPGYWEVASLPNKMLVILLYSTHPSMLEDSANGFLPFPVAQYSENFVAMPNGDGYNRAASPCR